MSYQMRYPQAPWGEAWMNAQPTEVDASAGPRVPIPRQVAVPQSRRSMGAALMGPNAPQDNPNGFKSRLGSAIQGLGSQLDPNGGGLESFLSGATGGYTNTQQNLTERAQAPFLQAQAEREAALREREVQSRTGYYDAARDRELRPVPIPQAPTPAADNWQLVPGPAGAPMQQRNLRDGTVRPVVDAQGRPQRYPAKPVPTPRSGGRAPTSVPPLPATRMDQHDRWDALVGAGLSGEAATAQVKKEHDAGQLDD